MILFLFKNGRAARLASPGVHPTEFFYGYQQLLARGFDVSILEDSDLGMAPPLPALSRLANKLSPLFGGLPFGMVLSLLSTGGCRKLNGFSWIIVTTNGMGMALAIAKALGHLKVPVLLLAMGLLPMKPSSLQLQLFGALTRHIHIACISRGEQGVLQRLLTDQPIHYIPFGVDADFWCPAPTATDHHGYVLAIGNDRNRDWATLVAGWSTDLPPLKIVTSLPVPSTCANVEVVNGDWRRQILSDEAVRELYRAARFVVIPLKETIQPAGQSACLQAMACGKAVILSNIRGLWNPDLMRDGETVLLTPPGDSAALVENVGRLVADPELAARVGSAGRAVVETHLNIDAMAAALMNLLQDRRDPV